MSAATLDWLPEDQIARQDAPSQWTGVTPFTATDVWTGLEQRIVRFRCLDEGWDGAGSPPVTAAAAETALRVLRFCRRTHRHLLPDVAPVPGGGVQLEWCSNDRALELEMLPDGLLSALEVSASHEMKGIDPLPLDLAVVGRMLDRLLP